MSKIFKNISYVVVLFLISITLFACGKKYTVTFLTEGKITKTSTTNDKVSKPEDPIKEGFKFEGWFNKKDNKMFDFKTTLTENLELVAKFKEIGKETNTNTDNVENDKKKDSTTPDKQPETNGKEDNNPEVKPSPDKNVLPEKDPKTDLEKEQGDENINIEEDSEKQKQEIAKIKAELDALVKKVEAKIKEPDYKTKYNKSLRKTLNETLEFAKEYLNIADEDLEDLKNMQIELQMAYDDLLANLADDEEDLIEEEDNQGKNKKDNTDEETEVLPEDKPQPNDQAEDGDGETVEKESNLEKVEFSVSQNPGKVSLSLDFTIKTTKGLQKLTKDEISSLKADYLKFLLLNERTIDPERLTLDMSSRNFKITINDLQLNDILQVKQGITIKVKQKDSSKVVPIAVSTNDLKLRYNGVHFVLDENKVFEHIQAQDITLDSNSLTISSTQKGTITAKYLPEESKGVILATLPEDVKDVNVEVKDNVITVTTTRNQDQESQVKLIVILEGQNKEKVVTINIVKDVNNSSTSEKNIITELTYSEGGNNKYKDGEATYLDKQQQAKQLSFTNGRKNKENLDIAGYNEKHPDKNGTLTLTLENPEKVKKIVVNLQSYKADKSKVSGVNVTLTTTDKRTIVKKIEKDQITIDTLSDVAIDLKDNESLIEKIEFEVLKGEKPEKNKPRIAFKKITLYR